MTRTMLSPERRAKLALLGRGGMGLAAIGPVMQIAFVPDDFDAALRHWTEVMGVGPFFLIENIKLEAMRYLGEPSDCVFTIALAYWGDLQVELIAQENNAPSIYRDRRNGGATHHVCILTDDIAAARTEAEAAGCKLLVEAKVGADGAVVYVDSKGYPGGLVEILQPATGSEALFAMIRDAARNWDGTDPVRRLG
jgi:methylmalonyl-CoA/ethylmalonyl-CoA epimerase